MVCNRIYLILTYKFWTAVLHELYHKYSQGLFPLSPKFKTDDRFWKLLVSHPSSGKTTKFTWLTHCAGRNARYPLRLIWKKYDFSEPHDRCHQNTKLEAVLCLWAWSLVDKETEDLCCGGTMCFFETCYWQSFLHSFISFLSLCFSFYFYFLSSPIFSFLSFWFSFRNLKSGFQRINHWIVT